MINIYTKANCPQCRLTKIEFKKHEIDFSEIFVDTDKDFEIISMLKGLNVKSFPVVMEKDKLLFSGFRPNEIKKLI